MEKIKSDPIKYSQYLEKEKERSKQKRKEIQQDPIKKQKRNEYYKNYIEKNKEKVKHYKSRSSEQWKKINIARRYGITVEYYDSLLEQQNGLCAICLQKPKKIFVDHCHTSGIVRALLCNKCNSAIGLLNEDIEVINRAIKYLEKHKGLKDGTRFMLYVDGTQKET